MRMSCKIIVIIIFAYLSHRKLAFLRLWARWGAAIGHAPDTPRTSGYFAMAKYAA